MEEIKEEKRDCGNCGNWNSDPNKDPCLNCFCFDNWKPQHYIIPSYGKGIDIVKLIKDIFKGHHKQTDCSITIGDQIGIKFDWKSDNLTVRCSVCGAGIIEYWFDDRVLNCEYEIIDPMQERICKDCIDRIKYDELDWKHAPKLNRILIWFSEPEENQSGDRKYLYDNVKVLLTSEELIVQNFNENKMNFYKTFDLQEIISIFSNAHQPESFIWGDKEHDFDFDHCTIYEPVYGDLDYNNDDYEPEDYDQDLEEFD